MTDYFAQLRPASFRGIPFMLPENRKTFGRRIATHKYPNRDKARHEDMGLDTPSFSIQAIIGGDNFLSDLLAFEKALQQSGPGTLIHPHYGEIQVVYLSGEVTHTTDAVGEVSYSLTFEEADTEAAPLQPLNTASILGLAGTDLRTSILNTFKSKFNVLGKPDFVVLDALGRAQGFIDQSRSLFSKGGLSLFTGSILNGVIDIAAPGYGSTVMNLFGQLADLATPKPKPMIGPAPVAAMTGRQATSLVNALAQSSQISIAEPNAPVTASQAIRVTNAKALDLLYRGSALAAAGSAVKSADFESREEALSVRNGMADKLQRLGDDFSAAGWRDSWLATRKLLAALTDDINDRIGRLPRTVRIETKSVRTATDLANRLYGDDPTVLFDKAADIARRNRVRHPGFVPASVLEVLL